MSMPLSGDTEMLDRDRPPLAPVPLTDDSVPRDQPADMPGSRDAAGWVKADAYTDGEGAGGWSRIDDVEGSSAAGWRQT